MADTYFTSVRESAVAASKRHLSVFNAAGSGKVMLVYRIVAMGTPTGVVSGLTVGLGALRLTGAPTGGATVGTPAFAKAKPDSAVSGYVPTPDPPAQLTAVTGATAGTVEPIAFGCGAFNSDETSQSNESVIYEAPIDGSQQIEFPEGTGFEVRQLTLAGAGNVSIVAVVGLRTAP